MSAKRFKSKIDRWILVVLTFVVVFELVVVVAAALQTPDAIAATGLILISLLVALFIGSLLTSTHYTVDRDVLRIASGPFRWRVPLDQISSVKSSRCPLSSPALSLDRILISYGKRKRIMVSPADKAGFLRAIGHDLRETEQRGS